MPDNNLETTVTQYRDMLGGFEPWQVRGVALIHDGRGVVVVAYVDADEINVFSRVPTNIPTYVLESKDLDDSDQLITFANKARALKDHCTAHRRLLGYPETTYTYPQLPND